MPLLLDLIVILAFVLSIYTGLKKGFVRSVMGIVIVAAAIILSVRFSPPLSEYLNQNYIEPVITDKVEASIEGIISGVENLDISTLFDEKPKAFTDILDNFGVDIDDLKAHYDSTIKDSEGAEEEVSEYIATPVSKSVSTAAAFGIIFITVSLVLTLVLLLVELIVQIPLLKELNKGLGLVLGIVKGLLYAWGLSLLFCNLFPHLSVIYEGKIPASVIDGTVIVKLLGAINITSLF